MQCSFCDGVAHPATGCQYGPRTISCGPCVRSFWDWAIHHTTPPRVKAWRQRAKDMKVYELTQDEYERQSVPIAGAPGTLVVVRQRNGDRRLIRFPDGRPRPTVSFYEAAGQQA
jgi:hypothetical protein